MEQSIWKPCKKQIVHLKNFAILIDDKEGRRDGFIDKLQTLGGHQENVKRMDLSHLSRVDFYYTQLLCDQLHRKTTFGKTKSRISRAFSMSKRNSVSSATLNSLAQAGTMFTPPSAPHHLPKGPSTTPSRRLSSRFSQFISPLRGSIGSPLSRRQISVSSLSVNTDYNHVETESLPDRVDFNGTFSLPTTPAPRKKKCSENISKAQPDQA